MLVEKIKEYTKRKELSNKAKEEILNMLKDVNFSNKTELKNLITELFNLNSSVLSSFILTLSEEQSNLLVEEINLKNVNKSFHIYRSFISLFKIGNIKTAKNLLEKFISFNTFTGKVSKHMYIGLDKALEVDDEGFLTRECFDWNQKTFNCFRKMWVDAVEYLKDDNFSKKARPCFSSRLIA